VDSAEGRLAAIAQASASVLAETDYSSLRIEDVASRVRLPAGRRGRPSAHAGRSAMWVYANVRVKRVLFPLAVSYRWQEFRRAHTAEPVTPPDTIRGARQLVRDAFVEVAHFCAQQHKLMNQARTGLGDASTSSVESRPRTWDPALPWGAVVDAGLRGRCAAFAAFLHQRIAVAASAFGPPRRDASMAEHLSDLAAIVCVDDSAEASWLAEGLEGYWFSRYVLSSASWAADVERAEWAVDRLGSGERSPRHRVVAGAALVTELLSTNVLLERAARYATEVVRAASDVLENSYSIAHAGADGTRTDLLELRSDVHSRLGLALHRLGRDAEAERWLRGGEAAQDDYTVGDESRRARLLTNLADVVAAQDRVHEAVGIAEQAVVMRRELNVRTPTPTSEDRLSFSEHAWIRALSSAGDRPAAVRAVRRLIEVRRQRGRGLAAGWRTAAAVLREAGHPERAMTILSGERAWSEQWRLPYGYANQSRVLELVRCARDRGDREAASALLEDCPGRSEWFIENVSPRLGIELRLHHAEVIADDDPAAAVLAVGAVRGNAAAVLGEDHPTTLLCRRRWAEAIAGDDPGRAAAELGSILRLQESVDPASPAAAWTMVSLAALEDRRSRPDVARGWAERVLALTGSGLDRRHPVALAAELRLAGMLRAAGDAAGARRRLTLLLARDPVLDPESGPEGERGGWNLPSLEEAHVVAIEARRLEAELAFGAGEVSASDLEVEE
jgi:hypothetical protein